MPVPGDAPVYVKWSFFHSATANGSSSLARQSWHPTLSHVIEIPLASSSSYPAQQLTFIETAHPHFPVVFTRGETTAGRSAPFRQGSQRVLPAQPAAEGLRAAPERGLLHKCCCSRLRKCCCSPRSHGDGRWDSQGAPSPPAASCARRATQAVLFGAVLSLKAPAKRCARAKQVASLQKAGESCLLLQQEVWGKRLLFSARGSQSSPLINVWAARCLPSCSEVALEGKELLMWWERAELVPAGYSHAFGTSSILLKFILFQSIVQCKIGGVFSS